MANLLKVAEMEKRMNISEKFTLPGICQLKEESNWNNNSKPAKPAKASARKPSEKSGGSVKPTASKSATKPGAAASKSATKTPLKSEAAAPKPPSKSEAAAPKPAKTAAARSSKTDEDTALRDSKTKGYSDAPSIPPFKQKSRTASVERLVPDKKSPSQIPSEHNLPRPQESERPKGEEKVKESKPKEAPKEKSTEEKQDDKDKERRATFCRRKERKSIVLSGCSPQATAYLQTVKKVFQEKDLQAEKSYMCKCGVNCKKMLIPKEVQPEKKKSDGEDDFAKRLTGESCGEEKDKENEDERPADKTKSFNKSRSNQQITKI